MYICMYIIVNINLYVFTCLHTYIYIYVSKCDVHCVILCIYYKWANTQVPPPPFLKLSRGTKQVISLVISGASGLSPGTTGDNNCKNKGY